MRSTPDVRSFATGSQRRWPAETPQPTPSQRCACRRGPPQLHSRSPSPVRSAGSQPPSGKTTRSAPCRSSRMNRCPDTGASRAPCPRCAQHMPTPPHVAMDPPGRPATVPCRGPAPAIPEPRTHEQLPAMLQRAGASGCPAVPPRPASAPAQRRVAPDDRSPPTPQAVWPLPRSAGRTLLGL